MADDLYDIQMGTVTMMKWGVTIAAVVFVAFMGLIMFAVSTAGS